MKKMTCPFCMSNNAFAMKFDCKMRPFYGCSVCSHVIFIRNKFAISSIESWCMTLSTLDSGQIRDLLAAGEKKFDMYRNADSRISSWSEKCDEKFVKSEG